MIYLSQTQLQQIHDHAESTYPEECCGLLLGTLTKNTKMVLEVREAENNWTPSNRINNLDNISTANKQKLSKKNRFSIAPDVLLQVQKDCRERQINIIGIYHSHPNSPAIPSAFDREIAWLEYSYIIASLTNGKTTDVKSWQLQENRQFQVEKIAILA
ncbi:MAG: M67 family metallopeptidase [Crocosphaera sp.]|nr:M67 family metallopeptidase [Crocosphaera sp.]